MLRVVMAVVARRAIMERAQPMYVTIDNAAAGCLCSRRNLTTTNIRKKINMTNRQRRAIQRDVLRKRSIRGRWIKEHEHSG